MSKKQNEFLKTLRKLCKESVESVDNSDSFTEYMEYIHVEREVERKLIELLTDIKENNKKKCLLLLCGSAGDGKSHLISWIKEKNKDLIPDSWHIYNDATESRSPKRTSQETLMVNLECFNDENLEKEENCKVLVAINLGVLINFLDSEYGKKFKKLKEYVKRNGILTSEVTNPEENCHEIFKHVNFSDYHIFDLRKEKGEVTVGTEFLNELFGRVFNPIEANPFYRSWKEQESEPHWKGSPIYDNYKFFMESEEYRDAVIQKLVEVVIKDKYLLSTREILDFIYYMIVPEGYVDDDLDYISKRKEGSVSKYVEKTTPMILYEHESNQSQIMTAIARHDYIKKRDSDIDKFTSEYFTSEDVTKVYEDALKDTAYVPGENELKALKEKTNEERLKKELYKFILRLKDIKRDYVESEPKKNFKLYIKCLYEQATGDYSELADFYTAAENAIQKWNGDFDPWTCIEKNNPDYWILEKVVLKEPEDIKINKKDVVKRFLTELRLPFSVQGDEKGGLGDLSVDYSLFKLILDISDKGYRPNLSDRNRYTDFSSYVNRVIERGLQDRTVIIRSKKDKREQYSFFTKMGKYKFEKVNNDAGI